MHSITAFFFLLVNEKCHKHVEEFFSSNIERTILCVREFANLQIRSYFLVDLALVALLHSCIVVYVCDSIEFGPENNTSNTQKQIIIIEQAKPMSSRLFVFRICVCVCVQVYVINIVMTLEHNNNWNCNAQQLNETYRGNTLS